MIDIEQRDLKKSFRKEGFFSKIGGLMALCETMKKHKLLKEPTFCETFFVNLRIFYCFVANAFFSC